LVGFVSYINGELNGKNTSLSEATENVRMSSRLWLYFYNCEFHHSRQWFSFRL